MNHRKKLLIIFVLFALPTAASFMTFFLGKAPTNTSNYGELLSPAVPLPPMNAALIDGAELKKDVREQGLRGKWLIVTLAAPGENTVCNAVCEKNLYAARQARLALGRDMDRVARLVLIDGGGKPGDVLQQTYAGAAWVNDAPSAWRSVLASERKDKPTSGAIFLVDPLGNAFMRYGNDPDIKRLTQDIKQVLKASQIG